MGVTPHCESLTTSSGAKGNERQAEQPHREALPEAGERGQLWDKSQLLDFETFCESIVKHSHH